MENKKGFTTIAVIGVIAIAIIALVLFAAMSFGAGKFNEVFSSINLTLGNQTFNETYHDGMKGAFTSLEVTGPKLMSIGLILGMVLICLSIAYFSYTRSKLWILLDIPILIIAEMFAVGIRDMFRDNILNLTPELYQVFITTLSQGSKWVLNMPTIIPIIGVVMILITYLFNKNKTEDQSNGGFYEIQN
jgi:hypothetical protein